MLTIDSLLASIEQAKRTNDWFGPEKRTCFGFDLAKGPDYTGINVVVSDNMTHTKRVRRTWRERWFSRPWRPWQRFKAVPDKPKFLLVGSRLITSPLGADMLRKSCPPYVIPGSLGV